jgi:selenocysteine-specific elongation factor
VVREDLQSIVRALAEEGHGAVDLGDICRLARQSPSHVRSVLTQEFVEIAPQTLCATHTVLALQAEYETRLNAFHAAFPLKIGAPRSTLADQKRPPALAAYVEAQLAAEGRLILTATTVARPEHNPLEHMTPDQKARMQAILVALKNSGLSTPAKDDWTLVEGDHDLLALLIHAGEIIQLSNVSLNQTLWIHADTVSAAADALKAGFPDRTAFATGEARALLSTSRKYIVPLLEHFDRLGITVRQGDLRYVV